MPSTLADDYASRLAHHRAAEAALTRRHLAAGNIRLAVVGLTTVAAMLALREAVLSPIWFVVPVVFFAGLAAWHSGVLAERVRAQRAAAVVEAGIARLEHRWQGRGATGLTYAPEDHPYAADLDIVGRGSLFDLLSTPRTISGEATLAAWLLRPAAPSEVRARQHAVRELADRGAFREEVAVLGPDLGRAADTVAMASWAAGPARLVPAWAPWVLAAVSAGSLGGVALWMLNGEPPAWWLTAIGAQTLGAGLVRRRVHETTRRVDQHVHDLALASALIERVEHEAFTAPRLRGLQARFGASGVTASVEIRRLARLVELLASRKNQIFGPLSVLLCWSTQLAWAIDRWRARAGTHVPDWLAAVGELEALSALGTFAAERDDARYPDVVDGASRVEGRDVRHPLLNPAEAIGNDVALGANAPHLIVVSGSNMSGKSTWLRTLGINAVLAQAGAPVCAASLRMTPLLPAGTLRVQDSLQSGRSRFFAEITKLRQIVDLARAHRAAPEGPATLFLLDELLAGTNSHDRRRGADAVLRGLLDLGAIGLATTHDLALTELAAALAPRAINLHLADRFEAGGLEFDYRLRPGVVETSNALALMRSIGLDV